MISLQPGQPFNPYGLFHGAFIPEAICKYRGLSPGAKVVYARLCRYAGKDGYAYPALKTLTKETGISETQARGYVKELEKERFIAVDRENRHYRKDGSGGSNRYSFLWHAAFVGDSGALRKVPPIRKSEGVPPGISEPPTPTEISSRRESSSRKSAKESQALVAGKKPPSLTGPSTPKPSSQKADDESPEPPQTRGAGRTPHAPPAGPWVGHASACPRAWLRLNSEVGFKESESLAQTP